MFEVPKRLRDIVAEVEPRLREIPPSLAARKEAPDRWSIQEIVGHLVDSASNHHQRFVRAQWQANLVFPGYSQTEWVEVQRYQQADWTDLVTLWAAFTRHLASAPRVRVSECELVAVAVPERPGLGVELNDRVASRHAI